jgi:hypothetical protein
MKGIIMKTKIIDVKNKTMTLISRTIKNLETRIKNLLPTGRREHNRVYGYGRISTEAQEGKNIIKGKPEAGAEEFQSQIKP